MILILNSGSSSIKFSVFENNSENPKEILNGLLERIGIDGRLNINVFNQKHVFEKNISNHKEGIEFLFDKLIALKAIKDFSDFESVGFRIVHGLDISEPSIIDEKVYKTIKDGIELAPLHNQGAIYAIDAIKSKLPDINLIAYFDTGFHSTIPKINSFYPISKEWNEKYQIKKYGFHGISYEYINFRFKSILKKEPNLIVCHLGNGASICSIKDGKSFDTTMGLTPLGGLMMGTRSGDLDPSILEYASRKINLSPLEINNYLNKNSGLFGVSGYTDMRDVVSYSEKGNEDCIFALQLFTQKIADFIIKMINQQAGKIDAIVFTAGIGENSNIVRTMVCEKLKIINLRLDETLNKKNYEDYEIISSKESNYNIYKMRTNEEKMICLECIRKLK